MIASERERRRPPKLLLVEDDDDIRSAAQDFLSEVGYEAWASPDAEHGLRALRERDVDAVLADVRMPNMSGIEFCRRVSGDFPRLPVVIMTAFGDVSLAVEALRAGAFDFITKPLSSDELIAVLERALDAARPPTALRQPPPPSVQALDLLIGSSAPLQAVKATIQQLSRSHAPVLITGESGTGKELVARALHQSGPQSAGPFVASSCAELPGQFAAAELFGFVRGAFPGAVASRQGLWQQAAGGTLFLDEVGDLAPDLQPQLLRVLETGRVRPLGSVEEVATQARVIASTHRDLVADGRRGKFKDALLYRLNVLHIHIPPLRERRQDILELSRVFLQEKAAGKGVTYQLSAEAERVLLRYSWPGNVRELENALCAAVALATSKIIRAADLPAFLRNADGKRPSPLPAPDLVPLQEAERDHIEAVLRANGWNKARAARQLGIDRATLYRKLVQFGLGGRL